ncbi:MAG: polyphosphate:AMP phosphotransferase [Eubacteriales bacterium]
MQNINDGEGPDIKKLTQAVQKRLAVYQQQIKEAKIPVIILFEGWGASGKGSIIGTLITELDPRGFKVYTTGSPTSDELRFPPMRRFWTKIPEYGRMSIFDRSWYRDVSISAVEDGISDKEIERRFADILDFERQLCDDGYVLIKFFLHLSKKEQKKRFEALEANRATSWRVTADDWRHHRMYAEYSCAFLDMIFRTDRECAPWIQVDAKSKKQASYEVCSHVESALEAALKRQKLTTAPCIRTDDHIKTMPAGQLNSYDLSVRIDDDDYKTALKTAQARLFDLHNMMYQRRIPLIVVYEGWDAAGKGGNIKRLTDGLDPRGYEVIPVAAPTPPEFYRHYMWRFWNSLPKNGHIAIYDRSWYGRVMVERVEQFCSDEQWKRAFDEINHFEMNLCEWGAVIIKLWLHIDRDEQLVRFNDRQNSDDKKWKITDEDWRNRNKWDLYEKAVDDMLRYTNTENAPWVVIESNDKKFARVKAINAVITQTEKIFRDREIKVIL